MTLTGTSLAHPVTDLVRRMSDPSAVDPITIAAAQRRTVTHHYVGAVASILAIGLPVCPYRGKAAQITLYTTSDAPSPEPAGIVSGASLALALCQIHETRPTWITPHHWARIRMALHYQPDIDEITATRHSTPGPAGSLPMRTIVNGHTEFADGSVPASRADALHTASVVLEDYRGPQSMKDQLARRLRPWG